MPAVMTAELTDTSHVAGGTTFSATAQPCTTGRARSTQWWVSVVVSIAWPSLLHFS